MLEIKKCQSPKMVKKNLEIKISKKRLLSEPSSSESDVQLSSSRSPRKALEAFINDQMSLKKHMQQIQAELKNEFMEAQSKKQSKKGKKKNFSLKFQQKIEKNQQLENILGLEKQLSPKSKSKLDFGGGFSSPSHLMKTRRMSLHSEVKSPDTAEILERTRLMSIFSPNIKKGNSQMDSVVSAFTKPFKKPAKLSFFGDELKNKSEKKSNFERIKQERIKSYNSIVKNIENRQKTFARFGFKTAEKDEYNYLKPILDIFWGNEPKGSMMIVDLWAKRNTRRYLDSCKLTKDKLILSKIATVRQKKTDFLRDSKKMFESAFGFKEEANKLKEEIMGQQKDIINHFKKFIGLDYQLYERNGVIRTPNPQAYEEIVTNPKKGIPTILKDVFINAFPGIYAKSKFPDICSCNTDETKECTEERSIYSNVNPFLKGFKNRFRRKSHNDVLNELINNLDDMHCQDIEDANELKKNLRELKSRIKGKKY